MFLRLKNHDKIIMYQTRIDKISIGEIKEGMYPPSKFQRGIFSPLIKKFGDKDIEMLQNELYSLERKIQMVCEELPIKIEKDIDYLRRFILLFKILNGLIEKSTHLPVLDFSWEETIDNYLHIQKDPNFMIRSMLREKKRQVSYNASILYRNTKQLNLEFLLKKRQTKISEFLGK